MSLIENHLFEKRGAVGCGESDYHLARTTCCAAFGVEDGELVRFYFDPRDLSRHIFCDAASICPYCGAKDWSWERIDNFAEMPQEWRWAAPRDLTDEKPA